MQGSKPAFFVGTLKGVVSQALSQVAETKAMNAAITVVSDVLDQPIAITVQFAGGRHGCGDEGTGVWAHTQGVYDEKRFDKASANHADLLEPILEYLTGRLSNAKSVSATATFEPYPGGVGITSITASSRDA